MSRTDLPGKRLLRALILASFVTPPFLGAFAWVLLGGPNAGLINQWYYALFGLKPFEATPLINIFPLAAWCSSWPCTRFPTCSPSSPTASMSIPSELEEASAILGAPAWRTALDITLPLVVPALLAGFLIAFLQSMTLFGTPAILALPAGIDTMTTKIWSLFQFPPQLGLAAAVSLPLLLITVALLRAQSAIMGRRGYSVIGGKSTGTRLIRLGAWTIPALALFAFVLGCIDRAAVWRAGAHGVREELVRSRCRQSVARTLAFRVLRIQPDEARVREHVSCSGSRRRPPGTVLVTIVGYLSLRKLVWGHRYLGFLATAPVAIPGIVLAVGLFLSLHATAVRSVRNAVDHLPRLSDEGASGRLPADRRIAQGGASRNSEDASRIFGATRLRAAVRHHDAADHATA